MEKVAVEQEVQDAIADAQSKGGKINKIVLSYQAWFAIFGDEVSGPDFLTGPEIRERLDKKLFGYDVGFSTDQDAPLVQMKLA